MRTSRDKRRGEDLEEIRAARKPRRRLALIFAVCTAALAGLCAAVIYIVAVNREDYSRIVLSHQISSETTIQFRRGTITDRDGNTLASSIQVYNVILEPKNILLSDGFNREVTVDALVDVLGLDREELEAAIDTSPDSYYVRFARRIPQEQKDAFEARTEEISAEAEQRKKTEKTKQPEITGVYFEPEYKRVYPYGSLACDVLGFSSEDPSRGNYGIEQYYNDELAGENGLKTSVLTDGGQAEQTVYEAKDGATIVTTLDYSLQKKAEENIAVFLEKYTADNIGIVVMDPDTGEILAMASDKPYDLNNPSDLSGVYSEEELDEMSSEEKKAAREECWRNYCVEEAYEPGSTSKPITVAAALEEGLIDPSTAFICDGGETFGTGESEIYVRCSGGPHRKIRLEQGLTLSCNDAMMQIGALTGAETLTKYFHLFGLGRRTGIDLPGESPGLLHEVDDMGAVTLATNAFGQNFDVTMVQLTAAFSSVVNGGNYYRPHLVREIRNADGSLKEKIEPELMHQTVSAETSAFLLTALEHVVTNGTGGDAAVVGYRVAGKTGTAEKQPRDAGLYLVSFIGCVPADDPQVVIYAVVDNPGLRHASTEEEEKMIQEDDLEASAVIAIELEKKFMEEILPYLAIS